MPEFTGFKPTAQERVPARAGKSLSIALANSPANIGGDNVAGSTECTNDGAFNLSGFDTTNKVEKRYVSFLIHGSIEVTVDLGKGALNLSAVTAAEVVAALLANTTFAKYCTAAVTNTTKVTITTLAKGTNASILARNTGANTVIAWATTAQSGTQAASAFQYTVYDGNGELAHKAQVRVRVYDASTAGALLASTYVQIVTKGRAVSGLHSNDCILETVNGEVDFEVASDISGADELYIDIQPNATSAHMSTVPSRENVSKTA